MAAAKGLRALARVAVASATVLSNQNISSLSLWEGSCQGRQGCLEAKERKSAHMLRNVKEGKGA